MKIFQNSSLIAMFTMLMTTTVFAEYRVDDTKIDVNKFIGTQGNVAKLQGNSTLIISSGSNTNTAAGPLVDGVTCQGTGPTNYVCSSDFVTYGCSEESKTCFYEENIE